MEKALLLVALNQSSVNAETQRRISDECGGQLDAYGRRQSFRYPDPSLYRSNEHLELQFMMFCLAGVLVNDSLGLYTPLSNPEDFLRCSSQ